MPHPHADPIVVIGAGLSGLTAAHLLKKEGQPVVVLEAGSRVGGRIQRTNAGFPAGRCVDLGGDLIHPSYRAFRALGAELGVRGPGHRPPGSPDDPEVVTTLEDMHANQQLVLGGELITGHRLTALADGLQTAWRESPPVADETVAQWGRRVRLSTDAYAALVSCSRKHTQMEAHDTDAVSLSTPPAGERNGTPGEAQRLVDALAEGLDLRMSAPVRGLLQRHGRVEVRLPSGKPVIAAQVIVAVSPFVVGTIGFDPPLPSAKLHALTSLQRAQGGRVVAQYLEGDAVRRAFSRSAVSDGHVNTAWVSDPETLSGPAIVTGSVCGSSRGRLETHHAALHDLDNLVRAVVGGPVTRLHGAVKDWNADEYALGVSGRPHQSEIGGQSALLSAAERRVRFAGDYTDDVFCGTFEGAVRSGTRAAHEVLRHPARVDLATTVAKLVRA